jgi:hypothetical protein
MAGKWDSLLESFGGIDLTYFCFFGLNKISSTPMRLALKEFTGELLG